MGALIAAAPSPYNKAFMTNRKSRARPSEIPEFRRFRGCAGKPQVAFGQGSGGDASVLGQLDAGAQLDFIEDRLDPVIGVPRRPAGDPLHQRLEPGR